MRKARPELVGIDFARNLRKAAAEILRDAEEGARKREIAAQQHQYEVKPELAVLVFEEKAATASMPAVWRMETLQPVQNGIGIVKVWDTEESCLEPEMREKLKNLYLRHGVRESIEECRDIVCKIQIRCMGTVRLKDHQRVEGEKA